jgi:hypothetical protein
MASETPIFFKVKWFLGYIFAYGDPKRAECISIIARNSRPAKTSNAPPPA